MGISQLEYLYDFEPKKVPFIDRKFKIDQKKLIITSPRQSGKSAVLFDHLSKYQKKEYLYIDFFDIRIEKNAIMKDIENFIKQNNIKLLIIENFDFSYKLPSCDEIIITSQYFKKLEGFSNRYLYPLDFEEYLAFEKKISSIEQSFNKFANTGTFPVLYTVSNFNNIKAQQDIVYNFLKNEKELDIFRHMSMRQSQRISLYQIYKELKESMKISKDYFYETIKKFEKENYIILVEKYLKPNASKKLYLIDFAIKNFLSFEKDFLKRFENIVFLELYKKGYDIFYTDEVDILLPSKKRGIFCIPFLPINLLKTKIIKRKKYFKKYKLTNIEIITLGNEGSFSDDNIFYDIIPFWNWALSLSDS